MDGLIPHNRDHTLLGEAPARPQSPMVPDQAGGRTHAVVGMLEFRVNMVIVGEGPAFR